MEESKKKLMIFFFTLQRGQRLVISCWDGAKLAFCVISLVESYLLSVKVPIQSYLCTLGIKMNENKAEARFIFIKIEVKKRKKTAVVVFYGLVLFHRNRRRNICPCGVLADPPGVLQETSGGSGRCQGASKTPTSFEDPSYCLKALEQATTRVR